MVKGAVKKTVTKVTNAENLEEVVEKKISAKKMTAKEREELLIDNFVGLQHAMTNLSIKFGSLSDNITKLLQVFEESAKSFISGGKIEDDSMLKKIDSLLDQNKTIAKGLILMEGSLRNRSEAVEQTSGYPEMSHSRPKPLPSI
ncbi:hypothetical protein KAJ38_01375 [Candidatus Pacearchaeota archaeon]|nr:hypothetical protein [Candidatus Pacearchaeota archaeon]